MNTQWEVLMGSKNDPENGSDVAFVCYVAAIFYGVLAAFASCQVRVRLNQDRLLTFYFYSQLFLHIRVKQGGDIQL